MFFDGFSDHITCSAKTDLPLNIRNYGMVAYPDALAIMHSTIENPMTNSIPDTFLIHEQPATYTQGMLGKMEHLLFSQSAFSR